MNRYKLTKAGIDPNNGIHRFSGNKEIYEKYLMEFPQDNHFQLLKAAIENKDAEAAFQAAHALKSIGGNLSLTNFYDAILPLVEELRARKLDNAEELFKPVQESYDKVIECLKEA